MGNDEQTLTIVNMIGPTTAIAQTLLPPYVLERLEGFFIEGGKLVKPDGMTAINTTRFSRCIMGVGEWKRAI
jgi:hypothetical protein